MILSSAGWIELEESTWEGDWNNRSLRRGEHCLHAAYDPVTRHLQLADGKSELKLNLRLLAEKGVLLGQDGQERIDTSEAAAHDAFVSIVLNGGDPCSPARFGGNTLSPKQMEALFYRTIARLHRRLDAESDADLARGMHYPTRWDPFFTDYMTLADVYHFATQHFEFHQRQLTVDPTR